MFSLVWHKLEERKPPFDKPFLCTDGIGLKVAVRKKGISSDWWELESVIENCPYTYEMWAEIRRN